VLAHYTSTFVCGYNQSNICNSHYLMWPSVNITCDATTLSSDCAEVLRVIICAVLWRAVASFKWSYNHSSTVEV